MVAGRRGVGDALRNAGHEDPIQFSLHLEEYGRVLYEQGETRRNFAQTVNVMNQRRPFLKHFMAGPWGLPTTWELLNPGKVHPPVPVPLLKAMVTTALAWQWMRFALMILLGYFVCRGTARCLVCESRTAYSQRTVAANKQSSGAGENTNQRRSAPECAARGAVCCSVPAEVPKRLWSRSGPTQANLFRVRLRQVLQASTGQSDLCVPSSLRAGGATLLLPPMERRSSSPAMAKPMAAHENFSSLCSGAGLCEHPAVHPPSQSAQNVTII